jgi:acetyl esterase
MNSMARWVSTALTTGGVLLAQKRGATKVDVQQKTYDGVTHEFFGMGTVVDKAMAAEEMAAAALKKAFGS